LARLFLAPTGNAKFRGSAFAPRTHRVARADALSGSASAEAGEESLYDVLGVAPDAEVSEIKKAYRKAAKESHPDLAPPAEREAMRLRFNAVNEAFRMLSDPMRRQAYDLRGLAGLAEFEFDGERIIMPPPWRVRVGHTGHHFWRREEYFVGLLAETVDIPVSDIRRAYAEATADPPGVGQAVLIEKCTERRANDIVDMLGEFGIVALAEEVEEEAREDTVERVKATA